MEQMRALNGKEGKKSKILGEKNVIEVWREDMGPLQQLSHSPTSMCSSVYSHQGLVPVSEE